MRIKLEKTERSRDVKGKAAWRYVFHRLRPLISITKSDAQISGGETRQDYKIEAFPHSSSLVRSPVPAFRFTGVIPLLWPRLSHSTPDTQVPGRQFAPSWTVMHEPPPFSPTTTPSKQLYS